MIKNRKKMMTLKRSTIRVPIFVIKPKSFAKKYGKKTKAITEPCSSRKKECQIHIRSDLKKTTFKNTITHELGHIITEKARIGSKIPHKERIKLREAGKIHLENRKEIHKREPNREMLAVIYQKIKQKNKSRLKIINREFPITKKLIDEAIRKIRIKQTIQKGV